jgi:hypothetical protein
VSHGKRRAVSGFGVCGVLLAAVVCVCVGVVGVVPAFGAVPEVPVLEKAGSVTAVSAVLKGELNPGGLGEAGEYFFLYRVSESECEGEGVAPEPVGVASGAREEHVEAVLSGLQPHAKYTFCLVDRNGAGEEARGVPAGFETLAAPPEVVLESESASPVLAEEATLNAAVNPENEASSYKFEYSTSASGETLTGAVTTVPGAGPVEGFGGQGVSVSTGAALTQATTYFYRVVAENAQSVKEGKPVLGKVESFKTALPPELPETLSPAKDVTATTAVFEGVLNPHAAGEEGSYEFLYKRSGSECGGESATPTELALGFIGETVKAEVTAATPLQPNATYTFCLLARNMAGEVAVGAPVHFTTGPAAPTVEEVSTPTVTSSGATLKALVNPQNQTSTSCVFVYGETTAYAGGELPCEPGSVSGFAGQTVTANVTGLRHDTGYFYQVRVASTAGQSGSAPGSTEGTGRFVTNSVLAGPPATGCPNPGHSGLSGRLPDCRAYELLTPPNKSDAEDLFGASTEQLPGLGDTGESGYTDEAPGEEGDRFFFGSAAAFGANAAAGGNDYVFSRAASGWQETALTAPGEGSQSLLQNPLLNQDFSEVAVEDELGSLGNPEAQKLAGFVGAPGGPYTTLFNLPENTTNSELVGASADFSRLFFQSTEHSYAAAAEEQLPESKALYEYSGGHYTLVNVEDNGKTTSPCGAISTAESQGSGTQANSVSTDGSHVFFLSPNPEDERCYHERGELAPSEFTGTPPQLYLRVGGQTIMVSAPETGVVDPDGPQPVAFAGASASGNRVWFITRGELTADDAGNHEPELYEYNVETRHLVRVSGGDSHNAVGSVGWVVPSETGTSIYFTAAGQLAPGAPKLNTIEPGERAPYNLYRYDTETASTTYIATVSGNDWYSASVGGMKTANVRLPLNVDSDWQSTPNGGFLLFDSTANITGYDPEDLTGHCTQYIGGDGNHDGDCAEVYRYDAASGSVLCVSCNPDGAAPATGALFDNNTTYREVRAISNNGAYVFFNTSEPLSALATNEQVNVYEWHEGEISLISSGQDSSPSYFLGTDASGADVFFGTHSQLVPQDTDSEGDLYDARIDGGFSPTQGSAACEGDACQTPPPPPTETTPASLTFKGAGNTTPPKTTAKPKPKPKCKKGYTKKKNKCVKTKPRRTAIKTSRKRGAATSKRA